MRTVLASILLLVSVASFLPLAAAEGSPSGEVAVGTPDQPDVVGSVVPSRQGTGARLVGEIAEDDRRRLADAIDLFGQAGLELPDVDVRFHTDNAECKGHEGLFSRRSAIWTIDVCSDLDFVVVHELAHAWIAVHVDEAEKVQYLELRGLDAWSGRDVPWNARGTEDAAFIMQQVLQHRPERLSKTWTERVQAFEFLIDKVNG